MMNANRTVTLILAVYFSLVFVLAACAVGSSTQPTAAMIAPASGTQVEVNTEVQFQVNSTDRDGIARIDLLVNGAVVATEISPQATGQPVFNAVLRYTPKTPGTQVIEARAYNRKGDASRLVSINLEVRDAVASATLTPDTFPTLTSLLTANATQTTAPGAPPPPPSAPATTVVVQPPAAATSTRAGTLTPTRTRTSTPTRTATAGPPSSHQVYGTVDVPAGATLEVRAKCPSGELRTGGGFVTHSDMIISTSHPIDPNDWRAVGRNISAATADLTAYAICVANAPGSVVTAFAQTTLAAHQYGGDIFGGAIATCPAGSFVTGGGHRTDPSVLVHYSHYRTSNAIGWEAIAHHRSSSTQVLDSFAVCYTGAGGSIEGQDSLRRGSLLANTVETAVAACPSPRIVTGGGFYLGDPKNLSARGSLIFQNGWEVIAKISANGAVDGFISYPVCTAFQ